MQVNTRDAEAAEGGARAGQGSRNPSQATCPAGAGPAGTAGRNLALRKDRYAMTAASDISTITGEPKDAAEAAPGAIGTAEAGKYAKVLLMNALPGRRLDVSKMQSPYMGYNHAWLTTVVDSKWIAEFPHTGRVLVSSEDLGLEDGALVRTEHKKDGWFGDYRIIGQVHVIPGEGEGEQHTVASSGNLTWKDRTRNPQVWSVTSYVAPEKKAKAPKASAKPADEAGEQPAGAVAAPADAVAAPADAKVITAGADGNAIAAEPVTPAKHVTDDGAPPEPARQEPQAAEARAPKSPAPQGRQGGRLRRAS